EIHLTWRMYLKHLTLANGWQCKQRNPDLTLAADFASPDGWIPAIVPGTVHQALLAAGQLSDPFVALNEQTVQWVGERDWLYRLAFDLPPDFCAEGEAQTLCCDGLDTFAVVWLNGQQILCSENMFLPTRTSIASLLRTGRNELHCLFESALLRGKEREDQYGKRAVW